MSAALGIAALGFALMLAGSAIAAGRDMGFAQDFARPLALVGAVLMFGGGARFVWLAALTLAQAPWK